MKTARVMMKQVIWARWAAAAALAMAALCPPQALAQVPARFYWKSLSGANAVPVIFNSLSGNTNPFDPSNRVTPDANFDATMALTGWAHTYALGDRSAMGAIILPMGRVSGGVAGVTETSRGFGDPMLEFNYNLIGPKAQKTIPDVLRYEPGFSLDLLVDLALPIGQYDSKQSVSLGQERGAERLGTVGVWPWGDWVAVRGPIPGSLQPCRPGWVARQRTGVRERTVSSSRTAPSLSRGWLPVPHLGDTTQRGQPAASRESAQARARSETRGSSLLSPLA